ncbi:MULTISPECIES: hypothetical protein [Pseudofrankia]|uniref:hypothetical protein n=1 Tax=Pseudofrankia TaxID=2994363 RepID=UPI000234BD8E|nr:MULTISPECIES: hypothetical protein [Pseudofrankia]
MGPGAQPPSTAAAPPLAGAGVSAAGRRRAGIATAAVVLLGLAGALAARVAFLDRLVQGDLPTTRGMLYAQAVAATLGVGTTLVARRWWRGAVLVHASCLLIGGATLTYAVERAPVTNVHAATVPVVIAAFGLGALVVAAFSAARRRVVAWVGALLVVGACAPLTLFTVRDLPSEPVGSGPAATTDYTGGTRGGLAEERPLVLMTMAPEGSRYIWADGTPWDGGTPPPAALDAAAGRAPRATPVPVESVKEPVRAGRRGLALLAVVTLAAAAGGIASTVRSGTAARPRPARAVAPGARTSATNSSGVGPMEVDVIEVGPARAADGWLGRAGPRR